MRESFSQWPVKPCECSTCCTVAAVTDSQIRHLALIPVQLPGSSLMCLISPGFMYSCVHGFSLRDLELVYRLNSVEHPTTDRSTYLTLELRHCDHCSNSLRRMKGLQESPRRRRLILDTHLNVPSVRGGLTARPVYVQRDTFASCGVNFDRLGYHRDWTDLSQSDNNCWLELSSG